MEPLSYRTLGAEASLSRRMPERVLQFGDGNFLRGFVDDFIDQMNEKANFDSSVVIVPPASTGKTGRINRQDGLYQLYLRGKLNGQVVDQRRLIRCVSRSLDVFTQWQELLDFVCGDELRFVISNTTEAGIVYDPTCRFDDCPPASFPVKLTRLLWQRWHAGKPGLILLPCELIADNGTVLRDTVLRHAADWALEEDFLRWLREENRFCNTLVDRIVTGCPAAQAPRLNAENGYEDALLDTAEPFGLWVIEGDEALSREFPAQKAGLPVKLVADHHPYKEQKVRILNGGHTSMVLAAYLAGHDIIRECMEDEAIRGYLEGTLFQEIIPTRSLPREDCEAFARAVEERKQQNRRAENTAGGLGPGAHGVSGVSVRPGRTGCRQGTAPPVSWSSVSSAAAQTVCRGPARRMPRAAPRPFISTVNLAASPFIWFADKEESL